MTQVLREGKALITEDAQDDELDALAARLYDRIRLRLRSELRVDRERAGRITDLR